MKILVTGGAGYIGSHVCKTLQKNGFTPITLDNFSNGHPWAVKWGPCVQGDLLDTALLDQLFEKYQPKGVIHLASLINVRESMTQPGNYYQNNVGATLSLLQAMVRHQVLRLVFSSTAAVYGTPKTTPISEDHLPQPVNVYGKTKWIVEQMLTDFDAAHGLKSIALRYFNAAGADRESDLGEAHTPETHLIPLAILAALGKSPPLKIFGTDHPTSDGTPIRDYIHVEDLAQAHVLALHRLLRGGESMSLNLGTGHGHSVHEVIQAVEKKMDLPVPREIAPRSSSDPPILIADSRRAKSVLEWEPHFSDLETIISTALKWHEKT